MGRYVWDLGFHFDHVQKYDGTFDLQIGLCDTDNIRPASPIGLKAGDKIGFSIYDLTLPEHAVQPEVKLFLVEFAAAKKDQTDPSPFAEAVFQPQLNPVTGKGSIFFGSRKFGYHPPEGEKHYYPIKSGIGGNSYEMTVTVIVKNSLGEYRKFIVDPEMIIDSQGLLS
jgi:hypothetical protein